MITVDIHLNNNGACIMVYYGSCLNDEDDIINVWFDNEAQAIFNEIGFNYNSLNLIKLKNDIISYCFAKGFLVA